MKTSKSIGDFKEIRRPVIPVLIVLTALLFINPLIGICAAYFYIAFGPEGSSPSCYVWLVVAVGLYLGAVNSTRLAENDLVWYFSGYLDAGKMPYLEYVTSFGINGQGRELFFPTINYILYKIFGPDTGLYITAITSFFYVMVGLSTMRLAQYMRLPSLIPATAFIIFAASPNIFSLSGLLLRQNVAFAIVVFVIVERFTRGRNHYLLMALAILTHASSLFFIVLCFVPGISTRITIRNSILFLLAALLVIYQQSIAGIIASVFSGDNVLVYAITRASTGTNYELNPLSGVQIGFDIVIVAALAVTIYVVRRDFSEMRGVVAISNIVMATLLFVISNLEYTELSSRFNFYLITFLPLILTVALCMVPVGLRSAMCILAPVPLLLIFIAGLYASIWTYSAKVEALYWPLPLYYLN